jgi:hypothetical protein
MLHDAERRIAGNPSGYEASIVWQGLGLIPFVLAVHFKSDHPESKSADREIAFYEARLVFHIELCETAMHSLSMTIKRRLSVLAMTAKVRLRRIYHVRDESASRPHGPFLHAARMTGGVRIRFFAVLPQPPVTSPATAVRAAIVAQKRAAKSAARTLKKLGLSEVVRLLPARGMLSFARQAHGRRVCTPCFGIWKMLALPPRRK